MPNAYSVKRRDVFLGKELDHGESGTNTFVRLAKRNTGVWKRPVHETWEVKGEVGSLQHPIEHIAATSLTDFVSKLNTYTTQNAQYLKKKGVQVSAIDILLYPKAKVFQNYILKGGFLDGQHGFVHAVLMSFHSFLTRAKLYLLWHKSSTNVIAIRQQTEKQSH